MLIPLVIQNDRVALLLPPVPTLRARVKRSHPFVGRSSLDLVVKTFIFPAPLTPDRPFFYNWFSGFGIELLDILFFLCRKDIFIGLLSLVLYLIIFQKIPLRTFIFSLFLREKAGTTGTILE